MVARLIAGGDESDEPVAVEERGIQKNLVKKRFEKN